jgi:hypothetical protein
MRISPSVLRRTISCLLSTAVVLMAIPPARAQLINLNPIGIGRVPTSASSAAPATRFKRYVITDDNGFKGMEVFHGVMPVDWKVTGGVNWKMNLRPANLFRIHLGDAQDDAGYNPNSDPNLTPTQWTPMEQTHN